MRNVFRSVRELEQAFEQALQTAFQLPFGNETLLAFYSPKAILPHGQSPGQLAGWLSERHPRYNLTVWCVFGRLMDDQGATSAINCIIQSQRFPNAKPYLSEWSYCDGRTNGYVIAPFLTGEDNVQYSSPFAVTVDANPLYGGFLTLSLASGQFGQRGAQYRMTGRVITLPPDEWEYEVVMTDTFGCIQDGYGPAAFLPQWLTVDQQQAVDESGGSIRAFLDRGADEMIGQGSYYYSVPLLKVDRFSITKNREPYSSGSRGELWIDYVVQGFDAGGMDVVSTAKWLWFGIQFPGAAMIVSTVWTTVSSGRSVLSTARFYDGRPGTIRENGAVDAAFDWAMPQIQVDVLETYDDDFPTKVAIALTAPGGTVKLTANAIRPNQLVKLAKKYEGVFEVEADISLPGIEARGVKGFAWGEAGSTK